MNGITHRQAKRFIRADLDGLLNDAQRHALETHLAGCEACRAESESLSTLTSRLQTEFHSRWDAQDGPSEQVLKNIQSRSRRIKMQKRMDVAFNLLGGAAALLMLFFVINSVFSIFQKGVPANETQTSNSASSLKDEGLLAFTSQQDGNFEIFTMYPDGSDKRNITNNPADDTSPFWSPDGKHIAFESDRDGVRQIYLMDSDGSNVIQLTKDSAEHAFTSYMIDFSPWSPDGSKLLIGQMLPGEKNWKFYILDVDEGHKTLLVDEANAFAVISWAPDGQHIALKAADLQDPNRTHLYVVNPDGSNLREFTAPIQQNESLSFTQGYHWSPDGQSLFFIALFQKEQHWRAYEARMNGYSLIEHTATNDLMYGWWDDIYLVNNFSASAPFEWVRPDETSNQLNPKEKCKNIDLYQSDDFAKRSPNGNWIITGQCANGDTWLYWANSDVTQIKLLLDSPIPITTAFLLPISWSGDDKFVTFTADSLNQSDWYILNVSEALHGRAVQPVKISESYDLTWQPIVKNEFVEEKPTQIPTNSHLLAYTATEQDGNSEIFTMYPDGSDKRNITNNSAYDANPFWSPDGKRITFQSDRNSNHGNYSQIFIMDADGSNVVLLTTDKSDHELPLNTNGNTNPWSPDGSKLLYLRHGLSEKEWILQYIDVNTGEVTSLINGEFSLNDVSWSPDGKYIGFVLHALPDYNKPQFHIVSADGTQLVNVSSLLPTSETFENYDNMNNRAWSHDGQSFVFVASDASAENRNSENYTWKIYKVSMDGTLTILASARSPILSWANGSYLVIPIMGPGGWTWVHPDGSINTINPTKECEQERLYHPEDNSYTSAVANFSQSPNGNGVIIASCPDGTIQFSWVNSTGTQVLPVAKLSAAPEKYVDWTLWSQDGSFFAFRPNASNTNDVDVYIVNIDDALKNPSLPLVKISLGKSDGILVYLPAWQPVP